MTKAELSLKVDLLRRIDMADLLLQMGFEDVDTRSETYLGFCRFHDDTLTKSFSANLDRKIFHCFGCGIKGDAIKLYSLWKRISYNDAEKELSRNPIIRDLSKLTIKKSGMPFSRKVELITEFIKMLPSIGKGYTYLRGRGISSKIIIDMNLRFLPETVEERDNLYVSLRNKGTDQEWRQVGIFDEESKLRFYNHPIIFPFCYTSKDLNISYFQGRSLGTRSSGEMRFLNPKGVSASCFFNHSVIHKSKELFICEGLIDTLSMIQIGIKSAVGTPGVDTLQYDWLKDFSGKKIILCFDNDKAGELATLRHCKELSSRGYDICSWKLPKNCKDINELLIRHFSKEDFCLLV